MAVKLSIREEGKGAFTAILSGHLTVDHIREADELLFPLTKLGGEHLTFDLANVIAMDTLGAFILNQYVSAVKESGLTTGFQGLNDQFKSLIDLCLRHDKPQIKEAPGKPVSFFKRQGAFIKGRVGDFGADVFDIISYCGFFIQSLVSPESWRHFRFVTLAHQIDHVGFRAVPAVFLMSFLVGGVFAQQGVFHARPYGGEGYISLMIAMLVFRELGLILATIIVSARSVSAFSAAIGAMHLREEVNALKVMGISPMRLLVFPRVLAMVIVLPVMTLVANFAMLVAALITVDTYAQIAITTSLDQISGVISEASAWLGVLKAPFLGMTIAVIGCYEGARVHRSTSSLSEHTTKAVVKAIFAMVIVDSLFAVFFSILGI